MRSDLDFHGQPLNTSFNAARRADRAVHEMLGLVKGVIVDGEVTPVEAQYLVHWVKANPEAVCSWPGNALAQRLQRIFADGYVSDEEREDLRHFLTKMVGPDTGAYGDVNVATRLPLDDPPPPLTFAGREFVFTGRFIWGTRMACEEAVARLGAVCGKGVTQRTHVLVVGDLGSRDWIHTSYGRKIEKAVEYRQAGVPLVIADEAHWASHLQGPPRTACSAHTHPRRGKVTDHSATCPRCGSALEPGFAAVSLDGTITELFWVAGRIERERLTRGAKTKDRKRLPILAGRCPACDTVSFAAPEP